MPQSKNSLLPDAVQALISDLSNVQGVQAIVLGGSRARKTAHKDSDIDLGIYYFEKKPLAVASIAKIANIYSAARKKPVVSKPYEWGAWVNGGAWIQTKSVKIDLLYRSIDQITQVIHNAKHGICEQDFQQQPPFGFYSVTYLGETKTCIPLYDPSHIITDLKKLVVPYPKTLQKAIIQQYLWNAEFSLAFLKKCITSQDLYSCAGSTTRILASLTQVLFAINREYFISDREAMDTIEKFHIKPKQYKKKVLAILSCLQRSNQSFQLLYKLFQEVLKLTGTLYSAKYKL